MPSGDRTDRRSTDRLGLAMILVVDDSTAIRRILRRSLENAGYRVTEAPDGLAALNACRTDRPDLVLLDVDMPVMDGLAALAAMKNEEALADIPVLFLTARTTGTDVAAGLRLGALDYLRKPCDPAELAARVENALQQTTQRDTLQRLAADADRRSTIDVLTGLPNRRLLQIRTEEMLAATGADTAASVAIIDIDHFKNVNDTEGHLVGDLVLRILAARLTSVIKHPSLLVRWGGEEFVALQPQHGADGTITQLGERLRGAVCATPFAIGGGRVLPITVSVGCASGHLEDFDSMLEAADEALYAAKNGGRNQVTTHPS